MKLQLLFYIIASLVLLNWESARGQTVKVVSEATSQPVENVYIFDLSHNKMVVTDTGGEASLSRFSESDTLIFQHTGYQKLHLAYAEVKASDFLIELTERSFMMEEVFVSASKREQDQTEIPQKITRIGTEQIEFSNPQTSADLLQKSGKVFVQKSQQGGGSPMIRGFAANSVLIAVDGIRMNNAIFRSGNLQNVINIDANSLENTEVLFGPGSIIYGSDALGGVMNFQTKSPSLSYSENRAVNVNAMARYSSADNEQTVHADADFGFEKWGFLTSITYSNFDDLRSGSNFYEDYPDFGKRKEYVVRRNGTDITIANDDVTLQRYSGYDQLNLMQKIRFEPSPDLKADYGFHYSTTTDIPRYDRLIEREQGDSGPFVNAEWFYGPQIWMMNNLKIDYTPATFLFDNARTVLSHQWFQESRNDRKFGENVLRNRQEDVNVYILNMDFDKLFGEENELFYGLETVYNYVSSKASSRNIETGNREPVATRYPDGGSDYLQFAGYLKYQQDLSNKITAVSGIRYSHVILNSRFESNRFYNFPYDKIELNTGTLSGNLGFTYRPLDKQLQFNLNGSSGFRAPNVDDVAKVFDSEPGTVVVPNSGLNPEHSYNVDFSIITRIGNATRLEVNTFYTWLRDAMVRRDFTFNGRDSLIYDGTLSNVEAVVNAGKAYIYGLSMGFAVDLNNYFSFDSNATYTNGRDITNNEPLRHVAPIFGKAGLSYNSEKVRIEAFTEFNGPKDINDFSPSERNKPHLYTDDGSPGWITLNVAASYCLSEQIQVNAGIDNILDKHYRPYSSGISAPGRNVSFTLRAAI